MAPPQVATESAQAQLSSSIQALQNAQQAQAQCASQGQLYNSQAQQCVGAAAITTGPNAVASDARMTAAEQDIRTIEMMLNQSGGQHTVCTICPRDQYVSTPCTASTGTQCSPCPAGQYSRGGYAEQCMPCASSVQNCGYATCTSASDATCRYCAPEVVFNRAYVLGQNNACTACGQYAYRSSNISCTPCPKPQTCAAAVCQPNSGLTEINGQPMLSSFYSGALASAGGDPEMYFARWNDGDTDYSPISMHTGNNFGAGEQTNPWFAVDLGQNNAVSGIMSVVLSNRPGVFSCRLFEVDDRACTDVRPGVQYNGPSQGAIIGVSDSALPISSSGTIFTPPSTFCTNGVTRNCKCGHITEVNISDQYTVQCNGALGRYVYIVLPGEDRILNFANMQIMGSYEPNSPGYSTCAVPCTTAGCLPGQASCSGDLSTARCSPTGCTSEVVNGAAYGYSNGQCVRCTSNQYRNAAGVCAACPCAGPCQAANSQVTLASPVHGPGQYLQRTPDLAIDDDERSYSETGTGANPYWQASFGTTESVRSVTITMRQDACGARSFTQHPGCRFAQVYPGTANDVDFDGDNEGTTVKISNQPCTDGQICPGTMCGRIVRPGMSFTYTVQCPQPISGEYINIQLPGGRRILQLANVVVARDIFSPTC